MADPSPGVHDATDEVHENNLRSEAAARRRDDADVLRKLMHDPKGRSWLYRQLERCHIYGETFAGEQTHNTAYRLGEENVGKQLMLEVIDASGDLYIKMLREQKDEEGRQAKELKRRNDKREGKNEPPLTPDAQWPDLTPPEGWPGHVTAVATPPPGSEEL